MKRIIPIAVLVIVAAIVLTYFAPGLYRAALFRRDCRHFIDDVRAGRLAQVVQIIEPAQRQEIGKLIEQFVPQDYYTHIVSFKLTTWEERRPGDVWAIVTLHVTGGGEGSEGVYQGKLHWRMAKHRWWWDFDGSYGAEFSLSGEPEWQRLGDLVPYAEQL